jgi:selenocysteine lyase/cysteine desulfurase
MARVSLSLAQARALFPIAERRAYLFSGGLAPAATPVREAHNRWTDEWTYDPAVPYAAYPAEWELARARFAALIGAVPDEIAVTDHTSRGANLIVQMLPAPPGANVVVDEYTFPSSLYPWLLAPKSGTEIRYVAARNGRVSVDDLARQVDDRTVALSITHVSPLTGFRHDLAPLTELAHAHGAYLVVDAAQSAGALDLDVRRDGVDFLTTCAMKWLLGAPGVGFLFVAREHVERFEPPHVGYVGVVRPADARPTDPLVYRPGARRHEQGLPALAGVAASRAGIDLLLDAGMPAVERQVFELSGQCIDGLLSRDLRLFTPADPALHAGVVALPVVDGHRIVAFLRERQVDVWTDPDATLLRVDPHFFNDASDLARFFSALDAYRRAHGSSAMQAGSSS